MAASKLALRNETSNDPRRVSFRFRHYLYRTEFGVTIPESCNYVQDNTGGLQVFHQNQWCDVKPWPGALVINLGDLMQLITNAKFRSVEHRVRLRKNCPRVSAACFLYPSTRKRYDKYKPIEEILSGVNPLYKGVSITEYLAYYRSEGLNGQPALPHYEL